MAPTLNLRFRRPFRSLLGAALAAVAIAIAVPAGVASGQQGIDKSVIPVAPDAPQTYVVQPGDTLWSIAARLASLRLGLTSTEVEIACRNLAPQPGSLVAGFLADWLGLLDGSGLHAERRHLCAALAETCAQAA